MTTTPTTPATGAQPDKATSTAQRHPKDKKVDDLALFASRSRVSRLLGRDWREMADLAAHGSAFTPQQPKGRGCAVLYHREQVRLIEAVLVGAITSEQANAQWELYQAYIAAGTRQTDRTEKGKNDAGTRRRRSG